MSYALQLAWNRQHRFRLWFHAVAFDHFAQAGMAISASAVPFAFFAAPDLAGVSSVILAITGLVTVIGGIYKVRSEGEQKKREWEYDHPPRNPQANHRPTPDSEVDEGQHVTPHNDDDKVKRVRSRRKPKPNDTQSETPS